MELRPLGSTFIEVSPIGLGLAALCRSRYLTLSHHQDTGASVSKSRVFQVLDAAWDAGVRFFDTGRAQGDAESLLAQWIRDRHIPPSDIGVASKWGYVRASKLGVEESGRYLRDHSASNLKEQWKESSDILGAHLQLYQIRSATFASAVLEDRDVLEFLASLKEDGVHVGLTVRGPRQEELIERSLEIEIEGERLFETIQASWNLMERSAAPALHEAHRQGLGIIVKEALANGRLTDRNDDPRYANEIDTLRREAERFGTTPDAIALAAALAQPWCDVVLSGAARVDHLESNMKAAEIELDDEAERHLMSLERSPEVYWDERETLWE